MSKLLFYDVDGTLVSMVVGHFVEQFGAHYLPLVYITLNIITVIIVNVYVIPNEYKLTVSEKEQDEHVRNISFIEFFKKYKQFMFFVLGAVFVFFAHTVINNFLIQIITPIGGSEGQMGNAVFIAVILELPAMMIYGAQTLQMFAFAIFPPASVYYMNKLIKKT